MIIKLLAVAAVSATVISIAPAAQAVPNANLCVTPNEFDRIALGMTRRQVEDLLDGPGYKGLDNTGPKWIERDYKVCRKSSARVQVIVYYRRDTGRVDDAWWFGGTGLIPLS